MYGSSSFHLIFCVIFIVFLFGGLCEASVNIDVDIINDIGQNIQLGLHCKSKNKDLGSQSLAPHQHWGFRGSFNFWRRTLFFCHFVWENQSKWFDILSSDDIKKCKHQPCVWSIRPYGPCRITGGETCFRWNVGV
ncbi:PREDICTED: uncharacterized protein LOC104715814 [Camelina sativa]|uniref:S-protein homolog n=1 Tax=Camelina sativa TaxID=90675 RepID=A0ABM0TU63_CAMSA|nr:PREDICTED: uncharacterized protein LOC104715814 [Camelina sativa]